jgi:hypothetical protein
VSTEAVGAEASKQQFETEAGPSEAAKVKPFETEETNITEATEKIKIPEPILVEETDTGAPRSTFQNIRLYCAACFGEEII